ncbi:MAG: glycerophosphodiester phosphodiesterase [Acidimicrobiia bacterium]|nr:MAG: glycerophosphodiester phosphodiesterase [Acidimicrobiia bacterium]
MTRTPLGPGPLIYAHRGDRSRARDNTIEAYLLAVDAGTDGIELDVRRTKDGILIVHHDDRDPDIGIFASLHFDQLRAMAPSVPTLREAMQAIPRHIFVNVEVKNEFGEAGFDPDRAIVDETLNELRDYDEPSRILLSSFDPLSMRRAGEVGDDFLRGQLLANPVPLDVGISLATEFGMDAIHPELAYLSDDASAFTGEMNSKGLRTVVWVANSPHDVATLAEAGVDVIITDDPGMAREVVDQL